jgi:hypothetical protein
MKGFEDREARNRPSLEQIAGIQEMESLGYLQASTRACVAQRRVQINCGKSVSDPKVEQDSLSITTRLATPVSSYVSSYKDQAV